MRRPAIVIVTYRRQGLLERLLRSIEALTVAPWRVVVVDNEASDVTAGLVGDFSTRVARLWGNTEDDPDAEGGTLRVIYDPQETNTGGAGGFAEGVRRAYDLGAEWLWVMDDDVTVLPDGLEALGRWSERFQAIQGQRYDTDGGHFYWQYRFSTALGIYNPLARDAWRKGEDHKECNALCFEGGFFSRDLVRQIGLPDARFFIYLDDALYGYLASKVTTVALVPDYVLRREREVPNSQIGGVRQLNSTSDMTRYYITRNRGYLARYYRLHGDYRPLGFAVGTLLTFAKELVRLVLVDRGHVGRSWARLVEGQREARRILRDPRWEPVRPLG